ncbi:DUF378 domain-containing protein [Candidatus Roizmanbacteria bacterium]|nr:DUF378 domain-containing protein [Candidatus Roizmanbacteria bacterium]
MKALHMVAFTLVVVGALNWGLVGVFNYNLVGSVLGTTGLVNLVYGLVGAAAVVEVVTHPKNCRMCGKK